MDMKPDLSGLDPEIKKYIESLEAEIEMLQKSGAKTDSGSEQAVATKTPISEPTTTLHLITITAGGIAKRTPRHFYNTQKLFNNSTKRVKSGKLEG